MDIHLTIAQNAKSIREQKKLTLDAAAEATGVSRSMLAQIEKGDANPSISVLWKMANGYKVSFSALTENTSGEADHLPESQPIVEDGGRYINYPLFPFDPEKRFETYRIVLRPKGLLKAQPHMDGTEEYITVFEGDLEMTAGEASYTLRRGESLRFRGDLPHSYHNPGDRDAVLHMIIVYGK